MRTLRDSDVSLIELALRIARERFQADSNACLSANQPRLAEQFRAQREHAEQLRQAFQDYPEVTIA